MLSARAKPNNTIVRVVTIGPFNGACKSMKVLVVGGAGYVGSHAVRALQAAGHQAWVFDNLFQGHRGAVPDGKLIEGNLLDRSQIEQALATSGAEAVMHFAALTLVGESCEHPARYYENNVVGSLNLLEAMRSAGVWRIVFSSTAATYGTPESSPICEDAPQRPINPYGFTKLAIEHALESYAAAYGFGFAALRYFNAAGASSSGEIGEDHAPESHLIPIVLQVALGQAAHHHFWRRLPHARRHLYSRLYSCRRLVRRPRASTRTTAAGHHV
jgi:UDP-glucose-4-epimerase GalE